MGSNFQVNEDQGSVTGYRPSISADDSGNFIITWIDVRNGTNHSDVYAQRYASDGTALDSNFQVNEDPDGISDDELNQIPLGYVLHQNYPNPLNPFTNIEFTLPNSEIVILEVYNIGGQKIQTLLSKKMPAGKHEVEFNGQNLPSGVYFYRMEAGKFPGCQENDPTQIES